MTEKTKEQIVSPGYFSYTRKAHATETAEDYVEAISDLESEFGEARVVQLARLLEVTHVTVNKAIARLKRDGYVDAVPYGSITLTAKGKKVAARSKSRHNIVIQFLKALGVPDDIARRDAEGIEHHLSQETLEAFQRFASQSD